MRIVKVKQLFFEEYRKYNDDNQLLESDNGRPCVLILKLKYKGKRQNFVVPLRSNISKNAPKSHFFKLPPTSRTKTGKVAGISYIKLFPITKQYIDKFVVFPGSHMELVKTIIDQHEKEIVDECQNYLKNYELGLKSSLTPDIDNILSWLDSH